MHEEPLNIPSNHSLVQTKTEWFTKKSEDIDMTWYDELDSDGNIIYKYVVKDATSMHPPFSRYVEYDKIDINGTVVVSKRVSM